MRDHDICTPKRRRFRFTRCLGNRIQVTGGFVENQDLRSLATARAIASRCAGRRHRKSAVESRRLVAIAIATNLVMDAGQFGCPSQSCRAPSEDRRGYVTSTEPPKQLRVLRKRFRVDFARIADRGFENRDRRTGSARNRIIQPAMSLASVDCQSPFYHQRNFAPPA